MKQEDIDRAIKVLEIYKDEYEYDLGCVVKDHYGTIIEALKAYKPSGKSCDDCVNYEYVDKKYCPNYEAKPSEECPACSDWTIAGVSHCRMCGKHLKGSE